MRSVVPLFIFSTILLSSCDHQPHTPNSSSKNQQGQIVNGIISPKGSRPYMVHLQNKLARANCGGVLIHPEWVLTAAHCTYQTIPGGVGLRVGVYDISTNEGEKVDVAQIYNHPRWKNAEEEGGDIALLKLANPVTHQDAKPIALASNDIEALLNARGKFAVVSGWGLTKDKNKPIPTKLHEVSIPLIPNPSKCGNKGVPRDNSTICGDAYQGKDSCNGDSGGPLAQKHNGKWYVLGIVSYGSTDCIGYGVYTRVNFYLDWIKEISGLGPDGNEPPSKTYQGKVNPNSSSFQPNGTKGFDHSGGTIKAELSSTANGDFDLYLQKKEGVRWLDVGSSTNEGHSEAIEYNATAGLYRWEVYAYEGSGDYQLKVKE